MIKIKNSTQFSLVQSTLLSQKIDFHAHFLAADHQLKVVLRGIPTLISTDELQPDITSLNFNVVDIALVKLPIFTQVTNLNDLSLDHNSVMHIFYCSPVSSTSPKSKRQINFLKYTELLHAKYTNPKPTIKTIPDIDIAITKFLKTIQPAIDMSTKKHNIKHQLIYRTKSYSKFVRKIASTANGNP